MRRKKDGLAENITFPKGIGLPLCLHSKDTLKEHFSLSKGENSLTVLIAKGKIWTSLRFLHLTKIEQTNAMTRLLLIPLIAHFVHGLSVFGPTVSPNYEREEEEGNFPLIRCLP